MEIKGDWRDILAGMAAEAPADAEVQEETDAQPEPTVAEMQRGRIDIILDRKRRGGKMSTIASGFTLDDDALSELAGDLRRALATGGSARGGEILLQGDCRQALLKALEKRGIKARII